MTLRGDAMTGHVTLYMTKGSIKHISPYSTENRVRVGYPTGKKRDKQCKPYPCVPKANYITLAPLGLALGIQGFSLGIQGLALGSRGFSDTNMLVLESLALGAGPNAKPQREWFRVTVEYRL